MQLENIHRVHMIGIGGIGMSALARFLVLKGKEVTGYDRTPSKITANLQAEGVDVYFEAAPERIAGADLVVYTPAVPQGFPEFAAVRAAGIPLMKRAEMLGFLSRSYRTIAVAGTHGKTSTTGLVAHVLKQNGIDATAFIGGISRNFNTNFVYGSSEWLVVEADEFDRSFLHLHPEVAVITSMDADHLDIYGTKEALAESFAAFAGQIKDGGTLFLREGLPSVAPVGVHERTYGVEAGACRAEKVETDAAGVRFGYRSWEGMVGEMEMNVPGRYNLENAVAALSVGTLLGAGHEGLRTALKQSKGINRRFEYRLQTDSVSVIDDYAHHPEEIRAVLTAVRSQYGNSRKLIAIFQPHLYSRTNDFYEGFADALSIADEVLLLDIYPAREEPMPGVTSDLIFDRLDVERKERCKRDETAEKLKTFRANPALLMVLGAGDIGTKVNEIVEEAKTW